MHTCYQELLVILLYFFYGKLQWVTSVLKNVESMPLGTPINFIWLRTDIVFTQKRSQYVFTSTIKLNVSWIIKEFITRQSTYNYSAMKLFSAMKLAKCKKLSYCLYAYNNKMRPDLLLCDQILNGGWLWPFDANTLSHIGGLSVLRSRATAQLPAQYYSYNKVWHLTYTPTFCRRGLSTDG